MIPKRATSTICRLAGAAVALVLTGTSGAAQQVSDGMLASMVQQANKGDLLRYSQARDWFIRCTTDGVSKKSRCELESTFSNTDKNLAKRFSIQIILTGKKTPPLAVIRSPLDLHLSKGVELRVGKSLVGKLTYRSCHSSGCVVPFSLVGQVNRRFVRGTKATLVFFDLKGGEQRMDLSLLGISNALKSAREFL